MGTSFESFPDQPQLVGHLLCDDHTTLQWSGRLCPFTIRLIIGSLRTVTFLLPPTLGAQHKAWLRACSGKAGLSDLGHQLTYGPSAAPRGSPELAPPLSSHSALIQAPAGPQEGVENVGGPGSAASLGAGDRGFGAGNVTAGWLLWAEPLLMLRLS